MKKLGCKSILIVSILAAVTLFTGCMNLSEDKMLAVCGSYAAPGMFCYDLKGGNGSPYSVEVIEKDSKGRILYLYETTSNISKEWEKAYIICQNIDGKNVYFYEDISYITADSRADLDELKVLNDWEMELDKQRMSARPLKVSADLFIVTESELLFTDVKAAVCEAVGISADEGNHLTLIDINNNGQELYWLSLNEEPYKECYLLIVNPDLTVAYTKTDENYRQQMIDFKEKAGWESNYEENP